MQNNTEKCLALFKYMFGEGPTDEYGYAHLGRGSVRCMAKSGRQPHLEVDQVGLIPRPGRRTRHITRENKNQWEQLCSRSRSTRALSPPPSPPARAARSPAGSTRLAASGSLKAKTSSKSKQSLEQLQHDSAAEQPQELASSISPSDPSVPTSAANATEPPEPAGASAEPGEVPPAHPAANPSAPAVDPSVPAVDLVVPAVDPAVPTDPADPDPAPAPDVAVDAQSEAVGGATAQVAPAAATPQKEVEVEPVRELEPETPSNRISVVRQLELDFSSVLRRVHQAYLKLEEFAEPPEPPKPEYVLDAQGRRRLLPPPPLWVQMPVASKGLTQFGSALLLRDARILDNRMGYEVAPFIFNLAVNSPLGRDHLEEGLLIELCCVHGSGLDGEVRLRLRANQQIYDEDLEGVLDFRRFTVLLKELAKAAFPTMSPEDAHARLLQEHVLQHCMGAGGGDGWERSEFASQLATSSPSPAPSRKSLGTRKLSPA
eukprot:CAMPEP_0114255718 /NCGR_PEP_ID=MMETSP0058-20121206/17721_1 /TAXON_ID=36894 /ORGANISM="Pyramimonas parkeae, CCMP726" /LENGTH=486 /DNA_ID=CAMNT_0001370141 /DNA_START=69 /DNA_END=1525 /DNA_ORIENTATION=+